VVIQWDPERDLLMEKLNYRSIQIGLRGEAVNKYVNEWIVSIKDITSQMHIMSKLIQEKKLDQAKQLLPIEEVYPLTTELASRIKKLQRIRRKEFN